MHQLRAGHQLELLHSGKSFFPALVQEIDRSIHEVRLETYIFNFDASGLLVAAALVRAAQRGVKVFLVMDGAGTFRLPADWARQFDAAGVNWRICSPVAGVVCIASCAWWMGAWPFAAASMCWTIFWTPTTGS
jgi:cardiolipin synthase